MSDSKIRKETQLQVSAEARLASDVRDEGHDGAGISMNAVKLICYSLQSLQSRTD